MNGTDSEGAKPARRGRPKKAAALEGQIERIGRAKELSGELISESVDVAKTPQAVLDMAWEIVFDFFLRARRESVDVSELNTLAGVVQKLVSSSGSLASSAQRAPRRGGGLSEEALGEIERRLKLL